MNFATFEYVRAGRVWNRAGFNTNHTNPQAFADALAQIPLNRPTDEIRVWFGEPGSRKPDAVVHPSF